MCEPCVLKVVSLLDGLPSELQGPIIPLLLTSSSALFGFQPDVCELQM